MSIDYELTERDFEAFMRYWEEESPFLRTRRAYYVWVPPAVWLVLALALFGFTGDYSGIVIGVILCAAWIPAGPWFWHRRLLINTRRIMQESRENGFVGNHSLTLTPDGLIARSLGVEARVDWSAVQNVQVEDHRLFIDFGSTRSLVVPERDFSDPLAFTQFVDEARRLRERSVGLIPGDQS